MVVLRIVSDTNNLDLELNEYQQSLVTMVRTKSGSTEETTVYKFLHAFFVPFFKRTVELILENAGTQQGVNFEEFLNRQADKSGWNLRIEFGAIHVSQNCTPDQLIKQLPAFSLQRVPN